MIRCEAEAELTCKPVFFCSSFNDNFLCLVNPRQTVEALGIEFSYSGKVPGKNCISMAIDETYKGQGINIGVVKPWADNFICVPFGSPLRLSWVEKDPASPAWNCIDLYDTGATPFLALAFPDRVRSLLPISSTASTHAGCRTLLFAAARAQASRTTSSARRWTR